MGIEKHEAVIVMARRGESEDIIAFRETMKEEYRHLLVGPVEAINLYNSFALMPDGSKEYWQHSDELDVIRANFVKLLEGLDADWAHVVLSDGVLNEFEETDVPYIAASSAWINGEKIGRYVHTHPSQETQGRVSDGDN